MLVTRQTRSRRFRSIAKDTDFYTIQAEEDADKRRCYFYNVDLQGRLFLEETFPKNIATSIKDDRFLDFFFRRVQPVDSKLQHDVMKRRQISIHDYPFVSLCGKELNFIRPAASPVVFHGLVEETGTDGNEHDPQLVFGGTLRQAFAWRHLAVSPMTGRIYHARRQGNTSNGKATPAEIPYGLVRSQLAVSLVERMEITTCDGGEEALAYRDVDGNLHAVPFLPADAEPGPWAMPWEYEQ